MKMKSLFLIFLISLSTSPAWAFKDCAECPEMLEIPAGTFSMGSASPDAPRNEKPPHQVAIASFSMGQYLVTQQEWFAIMGQSPSKTKEDALPVVNISWEDSKTFVEKLSLKTGKKYRLPTEAEWEYAARAGSQTDYFWGNDKKAAQEYSWYLANSNDMMKRSGLKKPNHFGLYDMAGNVFQWVEDCWNLDYLGAPAHGESWNTGECSLRVLRGGAWNLDLQYLRTSSRYFVEAELPYSFSGLRVARDN